MVGFSLYLSPEYAREVIFVRKSVLLAYSSLFVVICHVLQGVRESWREAG